MNFDSILDKFKDPKFIPLIIIAVGFGAFVLFTNKSSKNDVEDIELIQNEDQYYNLKAFGEDLTSKWMNYLYEMDNDNDNLDNDYYNKNKWRNNYLGAKLEDPEMRKYINKKFNIKENTNIEN